MNKNVTFTDAKVGDRVWSLTEGWGTIIDRFSPYIYYPIAVEFDNGAYRTYTLLGRLYISDHSPTLFWDEVKIEPTCEMWETVGFCEDTALSLADRTISSELYTAPQPAPEVAKLVEALEGILSIVHESYGASGYHLNGDIAKWCEFEEVAMAEEALALYHQQGGSLCTTKD